MTQDRMTSRDPFPCQPICDTRDSITFCSPFFSAHEAAQHLKDTRNFFPQFQLPLSGHAFAECQNFYSLLNLQKILAYGMLCQYLCRNSMLKCCLLWQVKRNSLKSVYLNSIAMTQKVMWMCAQLEARSARSEHQEGKCFEWLGMI